MAILGILKSQRQMSNLFHPPIAFQSCLNFHLFFVHSCTHSDDHRVYSQSTQKSGLSVSLWSDQCSVIISGEETEEARAVSVYPNLIGRFGEDFQEEMT